MRSTAPFETAVVLAKFSTQNKSAQRKLDWLRKEIDKSILNGIIKLET